MTIPEGSVVERKCGVRGRQPGIEGGLDGARASGVGPRVVSEGDDRLGDGVILPILVRGPKAAALVLDLLLPREAVLLDGVAPLVLASELGLAPKPRLIGPGVKQRGHFPSQRAGTRPNGLDQRVGPSHSQRRRGGARACSRRRARLVLLPH